MIKSPERTAWLVLIGAQMICLLIGGFGLFASQWFFFDSAVDLQSQIRVGLGTVGVRGNAPDSREEAVRINRDLFSGDTISTDEVAQGYLEFVDSSQADQVIANVLVLSGSQVKLNSATRPRFSFGDETYRINLSEIQGRVEIEIPLNLANDIELVLESIHGRVTLTESGFFLLWSQDDALTLISRHGQARVRPDGQAEFLVPTGFTANVEGGRSSVVATTDEIVSNPLLFEANSSNDPVPWACYVDGNPRGSYSLTVLEGRQALWLRRNGENLGHGEVGCRQFLGNRQEGIDVTGYASLRLRATMDIKHQSLPICGSLASECPIMLEIVYEDENGTPRQWIHGFYAFEQGAVPGTPRQCDTCTIPHDKITPGNWYTYETANLLDLQEGFRPTVLREVRFYTSGHAFEVAIAEVSLLAER